MTRVVEDHFPRSCLAVVDHQVAGDLAAEAEVLVDHRVGLVGRPVVVVGLEFVVAAVADNCPDFGWEVRVDRVADLVRCYPVVVDDTVASPTGDCMVAVVEPSSAGDHTAAEVVRVVAVAAAVVDPVALPVDPNREMAVAAVDLDRSYSGNGAAADVARGDAIATASSTWALDLAPVVPDGRDVDRVVDHRVHRDLACNVAEVADSVESSNQVCHREMRSSDSERRDRLAACSDHGDT